MGKLTFTKDIFFDSIAYEPNTGCWLWTKAGSGYSDRRLSYGRMYDGTTTHYTHRWSYEYHKGPIPKGMVVCHKCDTPECSNPEHLFLGTIQDNARDAKLKRRHAHGERNNSKLLESQVIQIREMLKNGGSPKKIAEKFGVTGPLISNIKAKRIWKHI